MTIWLDAHLSPDLAVWLGKNYQVTAFPLKQVGLRDADDEEIYQRARESDVVIMTKDSDFVDLQDRLGSPPKIVWLTCGNTSNANLMVILRETFAEALLLLAAGENVVEITGKQLE